MGIFDVLLGADCGLDVYEETSRERFVTCAQNRADLEMCLVLPVAILVVVLCAWWGVNRWVILAVIVFCAAFFAGRRLLATSQAGHDFDVFARELAGWQARGVPREQAIVEIKNTRLARENTAATQQAARTTAMANLGGMLGIARALRR